MLRFLRSRKKWRQRGQGMTEYIIIVALIAIGAIFFVTVFGNNIRELFKGSANALAGQSTEQVDTKTVDKDAAKNLKDFADFEE